MLWAQGNQGLADGAELSSQGTGIVGVEKRKAESGRIDGGARDREIEKRKKQGAGWYWTRWR